MHLIKLFLRIIGILILLCVDFGIANHYHLSLFHYPKHHHHDDDHHYQQFGEKFGPDHGPHRGQKQGPH